MDLIKQGYEVLYIWNDQKIEDIEHQVNDIKKIAGNVHLENSERILMCKWKQQNHCETADCNQSPF